MKNIYFNTLFLRYFLAILVPFAHTFSIYSNSQLSKQLSTASYQRSSVSPSGPNSSTEQEQQLYSLVYMLNDVMFSTLVHILHDLEDHLDYWHKQLASPRSYAIIRGPRGWFGSKTTKSVIKEHINALQKAEKAHAEALGSLHILRQTRDISVLDYATKSLELLSQLTTSRYKKLENTSDFKNVQTALSNAIIEMSVYKKRFDRYIYKNTKPSHLVRHWWKYLFGITAISAAGYTAYHYKDTIGQWYHEGLETLKQQWQQRIVNPIKGIAHNLSAKNNEINTKNLEELELEMSEIDREINHTKEILSLGKEAFEKEAFKYYQRRPDIAEDQIQYYVQELTQYGNDTDVMHDMHEQGRNFTTNLGSDIAQAITDKTKKIFYTPGETKSNCRIIEAPLLSTNFYKLKLDQKELEMLNIKLEAIKVLYQGKQQWHLQEVNAMLGAMIPAALAIYYTYRTTAFAFSTLFFKKIVLIPLQERILSLRRMLNRFDDGKQKYLPNEAFGHVVYWTHKLRQYSTQLPTEQQENLRQDILELESTALTTKQKHEVVKRMYDVYGFLNSEIS